MLAECHLAEEFRRKIERPIRERVLTLQPERFTARSLDAIPTWSQKPHVPELAQMLAQTDVCTNSYVQLNCRVRAEEASKAGINFRKHGVRNALIIRFLTTRTAGIIASGGLICFIRAEIATVSGRASHECRQ